MNLEIHGLSECLFLDIILIWGFVCICILSFIMMLGFFFMDSGLLSINDKNIIDKIMKLKNDDRHLYKFTKKLSKDNISFLKKYQKQEYYKFSLGNNKLGDRLNNKICNIILLYDLIKGK